MSSSLAKLAKYRQVAGIGVAALILTVIFVPFQTASAFTVHTPTFPNANPNAVPTSAVGATFEVVVDVAPGELIAVNQVELILDNTQPSVKKAVFNENGQRISGSPTLTRGNINIHVPTPTTTAYGYGFGFVADNITFTPPYSYSLVNPQYGFISGNTVGFNNQVGTATTVTGFVGPGQITITGKLNTALMTPGPHTLDVLIHVGTNQAPDILFAPQLSFTTLANSALFNSPPVNPGPNVTPPPINVPGVGNVSVTLSNVGAAGNISVEVITGPNLNNKIPGIFTSTLNRPTFNVAAGGSGITAGPIIIIDVSSLDPTGPITITIPYTPSQVPPGFNPTIFRYDETTNQWETATNVSFNPATRLITGTFSSLSPVVAGIHQTTTPPPAGTGGFVGGGGTRTLTDITYPASYFVTRPLDKIQLQIFNILSMANVDVSVASPGQQLVISTTYRNFQDVSQNYAVIIQVIDQNGFTTDIGWTQGVLSAGERTDVSRSWTAGDSGVYEIRIFVWDGVSEAPTPLSQTSTRTFTVG